MPEPTVVAFTDTASLDDAVRAWLMDAISAPGAYVLLAVGESTLPLYGDLPADLRAWERKRILPLDELISPPPGRSFTERLAAALPPELRPRLESFDDPASVEERLADGGICAGVLGLGPDGHIAFNQPGGEPGSVTRRVELSDENAARLGGIASHAVTVGVGTLMRAARLALVVSGEGKVEALRRVMQGPEAADMPASLLRQHRDLTVFVAEGDA